jgi:hypothetical protein
VPGMRGREEHSDKMEILQSRCREANIDFVCEGSTFKSMSGDYHS